jgi:MFS family permease
MGRLGYRASGVTDRSDEELSLTVRAALVLSAFTTALAFSVILPNLPARVAIVANAVDTKTISQHTGLITGIYTLSVFISAPVFGKLSDRWGRRSVLAMGLTGFSGSLVVFEFADSLLSIYLARILGGLGAGAVTPVALALIGDFAPDDGWRARRFAWMGAATMTGFMTGPFLGGSVFAGSGSLSSTAQYSLLWPAGFALASAVVLAFAIPVRTPPSSVLCQRNVLPGRIRRAMTLKLFWLAAIIAGCVAAFDVVLTLRGSFVASQGTAFVALVLAECSAVMLLAQTALFSSSLVQPHATKWLIAPALGGLALGLAIFPALTGTAAVVLGVGLVAAAAGIAAPAITYWTSLVAGEHQGQQLGRWTAVTSLAQALGSAAAGLLVSQGLDQSVFVFSAVTALVGMLLALPLSGTLTVSKPGRTDVGPSESP